MKTIEWEGGLASDVFHEDFLQDSQVFAKLVANNHWEAVAQTLQTRRQFINMALLDHPHWDTPLHAAARANVPMPILKKLLRVGAWRSVKNKDFQTPSALYSADVSAAVALLAPRLAFNLEAQTLHALEHHLHRFIRAVVGDLLPADKFRLPQISVLLENTESEACWFPVPGMYGGFLFSFTDENDALKVEYWSRVVSGSEQTCRITPSGFCLVG